MNPTLRSEKPAFVRAVALPCRSLYTLVLLLCKTIMNFHLRTAHSRPTDHFYVLAALLLLKVASSLLYTHVQDAAS
jgi:hypothetical protein